MSFAEPFVLKKIFSVSDTKHMGNEEEAQHDEDQGCVCKNHSSFVPVLVALVLVL